MRPLFQPKTQLLVRPIRVGSVQEKDCVVLNHPVRSGFHLVKQVERLLPDGSIWVQGVNALESTDSRTWGPIAPDLIVGKVSAILSQPSHPPGRRQPI